MIKMKKERGGVSGSEWRIVCRDPTWRIRKRCLSCRRQGRVWAEGELKNWGELILHLACLTRFWGFSICVVCGPEYWVKVKLYGGMTKDYYAAPHWQMVTWKPFSWLFNFNTHETWHVCYESMRDFKYQHIQFWSAERILQ